MYFRVSLLILKLSLLGFLTAERPFLKGSQLLGTFDNRPMPLKPTKLASRHYDDPHKKHDSSKQVDPNTIRMIYNLLYPYSGKWRPSLNLDCPHMYTKVGKTCLSLSCPVDYMGWKEARLFCRVTKNGDLAIFNSYKDLSDVLEFLRVMDRNRKCSYWVGASDVVSEGQWQWNSGKPLPTENPPWGNLTGTEEPNGEHHANYAIFHRKDNYFLHDVSDREAAKEKAVPLCQVIPYTYYMEHKLGQKLYNDTSEEKVAENHPSTYHSLFENQSYVDYLLSHFDIKVLPDYNKHNHPYSKSSEKVVKSKNQNKDQSVNVNEELDIVNATKTSIKPLSEDDHPNFSKENNQRDKITLDENGATKYATQIKFRRKFENIKTLEVVPDHLQVSNYTTSNVIDTSTMKSIPTFLKLSTLPIPTPSPTEFSYTLWKPTTKKTTLKFSQTIKQTTTTNTPKSEPTTTNTPKSESTTTNTPKSEPTTINTPKSEPTTTNTPKSDPTTINTPKTESTTTNTPKSEPTTTNTPKSEPTTTNTPKSEPTTTNTPKSESTTTNTPKSEPTTTNTPKSEPTTTKTPKTESTTTNTPKSEPTTTNTPKSESTTTNTPKSEPTTTIKPTTLSTFFNTAAPTVPASTVIPPKLNLLQHIPIQHLFNFIKEYSSLSEVVTTTTEKALINNNYQHNFERLPHLIEPAINGNVHYKNVQPGPHPSNSPDKSMVNIQFFLNSRKAKKQRNNWNNPTASRIRHKRQIDDDDFGKSVNAVKTLTPTPTLRSYSNYPLGYEVNIKANKKHIIKNLAHEPKGHKGDAHFILEAGHRCYGHKHFLPHYGYHDDDGKDGFFHQIHHNKYEEVKEKASYYPHARHVDGHVDNAGEEHLCGDHDDVVYQGSTLKNPNHQYVDTDTISEVHHHGHKGSKGDDHKGHDLNDHKGHTISNIKGMDKQHGHSVLGINGHGSLWSVGHDGHDPKHHGLDDDSDDDFKHQYIKGSSSKGTYEDHSHENNGVTGSHGHSHPSHFNNGLKGDNPHSGHFHPKGSYESKGTSGHYGHLHGSKGTPGHNGHSHENKGTSGHHGHSYESKGTSGHHGHSHESKGSSEHHGHSHESKGTSGHHGHSHPNHFNKGLKGENPNLGHLHSTGSYESKGTSGHYGHSHEIKGTSGHHVHSHESKGSSGHHGHSHESKGTSGHHGHSHPSHFNKGLKGENPNLGHLHPKGSYESKGTSGHSGHSHESKGTPGNHGHSHESKGSSGHHGHSHESKGTSGHHGHSHPSHFNKGLKGENPNLGHLHPKGSYESKGTSGHSGHSHESKGTPGNHGHSHESKGSSGHHGHSHESKGTSGHHGHSHPSYFNKGLKGDNPHLGHYHPKGSYESKGASGHHSNSHPSPSVGEHHSHGKGGYSVGHHPRPKGEHHIHVKGTKNDPYNHPVVFYPDGPKGLLGVIAYLPSHSHSGNSQSSPHYNQKGVDWYKGIGHSKETVHSTIKVGHPHYHHHPTNSHAHPAAYTAHHTHPASSNSHIHTHLGGPSHHHTHTHSTGTSSHGTHSKPVSYHDYVHKEIFDSLIKGAKLHQSTNKYHGSYTPGTINTYGDKHGGSYHKHHLDYLHGWAHGVTGGILDSPGSSLYVPPNQAPIAHATKMDYAGHPYGFKSSFTSKLISKFTEYLKSGKDGNDKNHGDKRPNYKQRPYSTPEKYFPKGHKKTNG